MLRLRYGLGTDREHTLEEIGRRLSVTRERVRQIESRALQKLRATERETATLLPPPAGVTGPATGVMGIANLNNGRQFSNDRPLFNPISLKFPNHSNIHNFLLHLPSLSSFFFCPQTRSYFFRFSDNGDLMPRAPVVIGVAGGSGSGKTTVVRRIVESLGPDQVVVLEHDRYYRDRHDLRLEERAALNYDHPDALKTDLLVRHVRDLKAGLAVEVPEYNFTRYARRSATHAARRRGQSSSREFCSSRWRAARIDGRQALRRRRRRHTVHSAAAAGRHGTGTDVDSVIEQYFGTVKPMHFEFVEPSKRYADLIVSRWAATTPSPST